MKKMILIIIIILLLTGCSSESAVIEDVNKQVIVTNEVVTEEIIQEVEVIEIEPVYIRVLGERLNVREKPQEKSEILGSVIENDIFIIQDQMLDEQNRLWYQIDIEDGWIASWFCKEIIVNDVINDESYACINIESETSPVFSGYSASDIKLDEVNKDSKFKVIDTYFDSNNKHWYKIIDRDGAYSWIDGDDCSEYISSQSKKYEFTEIVSNLLDDINKENVIDDFYQNYEGAILDYSSTYLQYEIFNIKYDEIYILCIFDKLNASSRIISSNDYYAPIDLIFDNYVLFEHLVNKEKTYKIFNLKSTDTLEALIELPSLTFYKTSIEDTIIYEEDRLDKETGLSLENLTDIKYFNMNTNESVIYKRASEDYDWEIENYDSRINSFTINRVDWIDGNVVNKLPLQEYHLDYYNTFEESKPYLEFGDLDEHFSSLTDEPSQDNIVSHMMEIEDISIYTTVEMFDEFETDTHLYFELTYETSEHMSQEYILVSWQKNNKKGAEIIERKYFDKLDDYMSVSLVDASEASIIDYMKKIPLHYINTSVEHLDSFESEKYLIFRIYITYSSDPGGYSHFAIWEKHNNNGGYITERTAMGISEIIEDNLLITTSQDFMTFYGFYNFNKYGTEEFYVDTIIANKYKRLGDSDWLIIETAHSNGKNTWNLPFVTEIDFLNIQTGQIKKYLSSDENFDWVYIYDDISNGITIMKKERKKELDESDKSIYEVIDLSNIENFILKIEEL